MIDHSPGWHVSRAASSSSSSPSSSALSLSSEAAGAADSADSRPRSFSLERREKLGRWATKVITEKGRDDGGKILFKAALKGDTDRVKALVSAGASAKYENSNQRTAMHYAAEARSRKVSLLNALRDGGGDINNYDKFGKTPLTYAAEHGFAKNVEALLAAGADANKPGKDGKTALQVAVEHDHESVARVLRRAQDDRGGGRTAGGGGPMVGRPR